MGWGLAGLVGSSCGFKGLLERASSLIERMGYERGKRR